MSQTQILAFVKDEHVEFRGEMILFICKIEFLGLRGAKKIAVISFYTELKLTYDRITLILNAVFVKCVFKAFRTY